MKFIRTEIPDAWIVESQNYEDSRGSFREWFKEKEILESTGFNFNVSQANQSISKKGVIRGIHYSLSELGQAKWITCATGRILDVIVDIRPSSPTYKKVVYVELIGGGSKSILIGHGLGHGFVSLAEDSVISYLVSSPYSPRDEYEINVFDAELAIEWPLILIDGEFIISEKDRKAPTLEERKNQGLLP